MFKDKSAEGWLKDRSQDNHMESNLWRYHDKLYDFQAFAKSHPGGQQWLMITKGQDITDYVQTYHVDIEKVKPFLQKYFRKEATTKRNAVYNYSEQSLFVTLRRKVAKLLPTRQSRQATTEMLTLSYIIVLFWLLSFMLFCRHVNVLTSIVYAYSLLIMQGVGHNFSHQNSILKHAFDPSWLGYKDWMVSHGLSHHAYPNTKLDLQITIFQPFIYILKGKKNGPLVKVTQFIIFFLTPLQRILNLLVNPSQVPHKLQYLCFFAQPLLMSISSGLPLATAIGYWYLAQGINAIMFMFTTFPIHRSNQCETEGPGEETHNDFGVQILKTTVQHDMGSPLIKSLLVYLGFTDHVVHHMFPAIDKSRLPLIHPIFIDTCKQLGLSHHLKVRTYPQIVQGYLDRLRNSSK